MSSTLLKTNIYESHAKTGIYLDYAATTPVDSRVASVMNEYLTIDGIFGNPASETHGYGQAAAKAVENARNEVAGLLFSKPNEIIWTSGATEAINLALKGVAFARKDLGKHIVVSSLEHKAVLDSALWLESLGYEITYVSPDKEGVISSKNLYKFVRPDTILVSLSLVNNEVGTITDISEIATLLDQKETLLHVDAVQGAARLSLNEVGKFADLISISGHKMYGPKGIGALRVRRKIQNEVVPLIHGGGQEFGLRSGTLPTHQIVGIGEAAKIVKTNREVDTTHVTNLDRRLCMYIDDIEGAMLNVKSKKRVPGILNVYFSKVEAESLMLALGNVAISSGSACTSKDIRPSHVLHALGYSGERALSSVRLSFGRFTTIEEIDRVGTLLNETVTVLRKISK